MSQSYQRRLDALAAGITDLHLERCLIGLEKEGLRVSPEGLISQRTHPSALGSPLTHPWITTDYSEALLELITPALARTRQVLEFLDDMHVFVHQHLDDELLWSASMPCVLQGEQSIPVARYGDSNAGQMKHIYRLGLGHRYGRVMQVIAGMHYNFSLPETFWGPYRDLLGSTVTQREFIDDSYFCLVRNALRLGWMIPYLFGASPAVCKSFFGEAVPTDLDMFDNNTCYEKWGTSLRLGDMGYQNKKEVDSGVRICYDNLADYTRCLERAISTPSSEYQGIGVKVDGRYRQLSANILQIEAEYYSSVRPKQLCAVEERAVDALRRRGVRYVELRSLDINTDDPRGMDHTQVCFLQAWMMYCLLTDSPPIPPRERDDIDQNLLLTAHQGREPGLLLQRDGGGVALRDWGLEVCDAMAGICESLDRVHGGDDYQHALASQREKFLDTELTPSAKVLREMRDNGEGFFDFAMRRSREFQAEFRGRSLSPEQEQLFRLEAERSIEAQRRIEAEDSGSLDEFIARYLAGG